MKKYLLSVLVTCSLLIQGCASHPLVPNVTQGKTFAVYPASIALTVKEDKGLLGLVKDVSIFVVTTSVTGALTSGNAVVIPEPEPGRKVTDGNLGPALMNELAVRIEREFKMSKAADLKPLASSKFTGGQLTEAEVKSDYQNAADYLVQFDSLPSTLSVGGSGDNYTFKYFVTVNVYEVKTGQRLDWATCNGVHGAAPLADWFKDSGKMLDVETPKIASKCADEVIRKLIKAN